MTLDEFIKNPSSKYAVVRHDSYLIDPVAQTISASPTVFTHQGVAMVILSLEPASVQNLCSYADTVANGVEFELTLGSGKVTLLTHEQATALITPPPPP